MVYLCLMVLFIMPLSYQSSFASMFGWIWSKDTDDTTVLVADGVPLISIPYDSMTEDEKFLQEAAKITDIQVSSPLETCKHKVIMKIKSSCSEMSEEQLAKLSVNLLNCQSAVEGRKMFPCTDEMSLKQCTTNMDADMWNAYHLMSNRARAVCYAARNTQFRALTELAVNKLMSTAQMQIKTLSSLKESQDHLKEQTVETFSSLSEGNKVLLEQQKRLKDAQTLAYNFVTTNLKKELEEAFQNLEQQAIERGENHKEIMEDLMNIQEQAQLIWDKIESNRNQIFTQHEEMLAQNEQILEKLSQINVNIQYFWNITNIMRAKVDQKLNWLTNYIGDTEEQMYRSYYVGLHIVYLLFVMVVAAFLQAPLLTRITILGIIPLNLITYLKHGLDACLDFVSMTVLIFLITMMYFVIIGIQRLFGSKNKAKRLQPIQVNNQNGYANGAAQKYVSTFYKNLHSSCTPLVSFYTKLMRNTRQFYSFIRYQIKRYIQKFYSLIQSAISWNKRSSMHREELSCSYMPSRKTREDLVYNYEREFPSMSEDNTDSEPSNVLDERSGSIDDFHRLIDANDLRRRLMQIEGSVSSTIYSRQRSLSRR